MFNAVRLKVGVYRAYRKVHSLWDSFLQLRRSGNPESWLILRDFLQTFLKAYSLYFKKEFIDSADDSAIDLEKVSDEISISYSEHSKSEASTAPSEARNDSTSQESLQQIFGDLTRILPILLDIVSEILASPSLPSGMNEGLCVQICTDALALVDIFAKDDIYRQKMNQNDNIIPQLVSYLAHDKLSIDAKLHVLQTMMLLSKKLENRELLSKSSVLLTMFDILDNSENPMVKEVLKTLRFMLEIERNDSEEDFAQSLELINLGGDSHTHLDTELSISISLSKSESNINAESELPTADAASVNLPINKRDSSKSQRFNLLHLNTVLKPPVSNQEDRIRQNQDHSYPSRKITNPSQKSKFSQIGIPLSQSIVSKFRNQSEENMISLFGFNSKNLSTESLLPSHPKDLIFSHAPIKSMVHSQGALEKLTKSLSKGSISFRLDVLETIGKLLSTLKTPIMHLQFRALGGLDLIESLMAEIIEADSGRISSLGNSLELFPSSFFLDRALGICAAICLNGNSSGMIGNYVFLSFMFKLYNKLPFVENKLAAISLLETIQDLISIQPINAIHMFQIDSFPIFKQWIINLLSNPSNADVLRCLLKTLTYITTALTYHNTYFVEMLADIVIHESISITSEQIVTSLCDLCRHFYSYRVCFTGKPEIINTCIKHLCALIPYRKKQMKDNSLSVDENQVLLIMELLLHFIIDISNAEEQVAYFASKDGFDIIKELFLYSGFSKISLACLQFLKAVSLRQFAFERRALATLVSMLDDEIPMKDYRRHILMVLSEILRNSDSNGGDFDPRLEFQHCGGILRCYELFKNLNDLDLALTSLRVLVDSYSGYLSNKEYICEKIGLLAFAQTLQCRIPVSEFTAEIFDYVLELCTSQNYCKVFKQSFSFKAPSQTLFCDISDWIRRISCKEFSLNDGLLPVHNKTFLILFPQQQFSNGRGVAIPNAQMKASGTITGLKHVSSEPSIHKLPNIAQPGSPDSLQLSVPSKTSLHKSRSTLSVKGDIQFVRKSPTSDSLDLKSNFGSSKSSNNLDESVDMKRNSFSSSVGNFRRLITCRFLSEEAALVIVLLLPNTSWETQKTAINRFLLILDASPYNCKCMSSMSILSFLVRIVPRFPDSLQSSYMQLIAAIGSYDITALDLAQILDLCVLSFDGHDIFTGESLEDLQMQLLYVLGRLAERVSPPSYFWLDGETKALKFDLTKFPSSKQGYSFMMWFKVCRLQSVGKTQLCKLMNYKGDTFLELYFLSSDRSEGQLYFSSSACIAEDCSLNSQRFLADSDCWNLLSITHSKQTLSIYLNGFLVKMSHNALFPSGVSKSKMVSLFIGGSVKLDPIQTVSLSETHFVPHIDLFCGMISNIFLFEGIMDSKQVNSSWNLGCTSSNFIKTTNVDLRIILSYDYDVLSNLSLLSPKKAFSRLGFLRVSKSDRNESTDARNSCISQFKIDPLINADLSLENEMHSFEESNDFFSSNGTNKIDRRSESFSPPCPQSIHSSFLVSPTLFESFSGCDVNVNASEDLRASSIDSSVIELSRKSTVNSLADDNLRDHTLVEFHCIGTITTEIKKIGGPFVLLKILSSGIRQQFASLRILALLLDNCSEMLNDFEVHRGFSILGYLLSNHSQNLTLDTFQILIEIVCGTGSPGLLKHDKQESNGEASHRNLRFKIRRPSSVFLIFDLLKYSSPRDRFHMISLLSDVLLEPENKDLLKAYPGINGILELFQLSSESSRNLLLMIEHFLKDSEGEEFDKLMNFLVTDDSNFVDEKVAICNMLLRSLSLAPAFVVYLQKADNFLVLFSLFDSPSESLRISSFRLLDLVFKQSPRLKAVFTSRFLGFDVMQSILGSQRLIQISSFECLLKLALNEPVSSSDQHSFIENFDIESMTIPVVSQPELLRIILYVLGKSDDANIHIQILDYLSRLLDSNQNIELLVICDMFLWISLYFMDLRAISFRDDDDLNLKFRVTDKLRLVVQKLLFYEMSQPLRYSRISKLREIIECRDFQIFCHEAVVLHIEFKPALDINIASNWLRQFSHQIDFIEEAFGFSPGLCLRTAHSINLLASQNDDLIRTKMKDSQMFELRDSLVMEFITQDVSSSIQLEEIIEALPHLSLETVAGNPRFKNTRFILYLLRLFLLCSHERGRIILLDSIRCQLGAHEDHRVDLIKVVEHGVVLCNLLPELRLSELKASGVTTVNLFPDSESASSLESVDWDQIATILSAAQFEHPEDFNLWFFADDQLILRSKIIERLSLSLSDARSNYFKLKERNLQRRNKKLKQRMEKLEKSRIFLEKSVIDIVEKCRQRSKKCRLEYFLDLEKAVDSRIQRCEDGESAWIQILEKLKPFSCEVSDEVVVVDSSVLPSDNSLDLYLSQDEYINHRDNPTPSHFESILSPIDGKHRLKSVWKCPVCEQVVHSRWDLISHYRIDHQILVRESI